MQTIQVRAILALWAVVCAAVPAGAWASGNGKTILIKGEIESRQPIPGGYTIQFNDPGGDGPPVRAEIRPDGEFEFRGTPYGLYVVTITSARGEVVYEGSAAVGGGMDKFTIRLPVEDRARPNAETISVWQLQHPPARKAVEALRAAQKFSESGDNESAVAWIGKAIAISPDYADAWVNLGARHIGMGRYDEAIGETRHAMELAGKSAMALCNIAYAQALLGRDAEARQSAEEAVKLKPDDAHANYILGVILYRAHAPNEEVMRHLRVAAPAIAGARAAMEKIEGK